MNDIDEESAEARERLDALWQNDRQRSFYLVVPGLAIDWDAGPRTLRVMPMGLDYAFGMTLEAGVCQSAVTDEFRGADSYDVCDPWPSAVIEGVTSGNLVTLDMDGVSGLWLNANRSMVCRVANLWPCELTVFNVDADYVASVAQGRGLEVPPDDVALDIAEDAATGANESLCETDVLDDVLDDRIAEAVRDWMDEGGRK